MDLIGEIVEHDVVQATEPVPFGGSASSGFPQLKRFELKKRGSRFKNSQPKSAPSSVARAEAQPKSGPKHVESEAEKIHRENLEKISSLTEEELTREREELLQGLDPKLVQSLLKRTEARAHQETHNHDHVEGYGGWIGGGKNGVELAPLDDADVNKALGIKSVQFSEKEEVKNYPMDYYTDEEEAEEEAVVQDSHDNEVAPEGYQIVSDDESPDVHFVKPKPPTDDPELDINDPEFLDKLHEKYYPDLPKETKKLAWMKAPVPAYKLSSYEAISDMRFDFKGNLVDLDEKSQETPTHLGLHHHSDNPQLAGYTLGELVHLSRSVVPTQRCLGIQMLGRILHKLGLHKYNIMPIIEAEDNDVINQESRQAMDQFEDMMWDLIAQLRVIDSLTEASDEARTRNLSVRSYAIEALWLWKQGGGRVEGVKKSEEEILAEQLNNL